MSNFTMDIEKQLSKLGRDIQQFVEKVVPLQTDEGDFQPACDIVEGSDRYVIYLDLPGLKKKEVKVSLKDEVITVSGEREFTLREDETLKRNERKQGMFIRSFALPEHVESSSISAKFVDGVLRIILSKKEGDQEKEAHSIPVD